MSDNAGIVLAITIVVAGAVGLGAIGRGCYGKASDEDAAKEAARQKSFQVCVQSGRGPEECHRGLP